MRVRPVAFQIMFSCIFLKIYLAYFSVDIMGPKHDFLQFKNSLNFNV